MKKILNSQYTQWLVTIGSWVGAYYFFKFIFS